MVCQVHDCSVNLVIERIEPELARSVLPLPVSRSGRFSQLFYLTAGTSHLYFSPIACQDHDIPVQNLTLRRVGTLERIIKMLYRVLAFCVKNPLQVRHTGGMRWYMPLIDMEKAYEIAGRFLYHSPALSYEQWIEQFDRLSWNNKIRIKKQIARWNRSPVFEIVVLIERLDQGAFLKSIESLQRQLYSDFRVTLLISAQRGDNNCQGTISRWLKEIDAKLNIEIVVRAQWADSALIRRIKSGDCPLQKRAESGPGDERPSSWVLVLRPGDRLAEHALYWIADAILKRGDIGLIYSDHDRIDENAVRRQPAFKPDWSPELLRSGNYIGSSVAVRSDYFVGAAFDGVNLDAFDCHALLLTISEYIGCENIHHIPAILWHLPLSGAESSPLKGRLGTNPVANHLQRVGAAATVEPVSDERYRVCYDIPEDQPLVSIVIPTRNALDYLSRCVRSVMELTRYRNFEVIVVDNRTDDPAAIDYLGGLMKNSRIRVLRFDRPFNFSAINNFAAGEAYGDVLCLLNNDTEVITPAWLEEMVGHLLQPDVGVVGAKLYYGDGRVQHAGDTVGPGGVANHLHALIARDEPGYCDRARLAQDLSAVTGACLVTWSALYRDLGGLDEKNLPVAFNDVDYCLRVRESGKRVIWTPYAELYHHESVSRGHDKKSPDKIKRAKREARYMRKRWKKVMRHDPFYNPNLSYQRPDFSLSHAPRVIKPWENVFRPFG